MSQPEQGLSPGLQVGFALLVGVAVIGFFVGTGDGDALRNPLVGHAEGEVAAHEAVAHEAGEGERASVGAMPSYAMIRARGRGTDSDWQAEAAALTAGSVGDGALADRGVALTDRAQNRAYDGAPPTIPHAVRQRAAAECLACHADGLRLRGKKASVISHDEYASCTQCHVVSERPMPGAALEPDASFGPNSFVGMASPTRGERAWSIAPPTMPHRSSMRENCMSCHGPEGRDAMVTPHPERQSCQQCHPPSARRLDAAPEGKQWLGLRDIKPRGPTDVPEMAMPAERALSAEMKRVGERPPPWIPGCDDEGKA